MKTLMANTVKRRIAVLHAKISDIGKQSARDIAGLRDEILAVQSRCAHADHTYYPDASGNNDSYTLCNVCGKEL